MKRHVYALLTTFAFLPTTALAAARVSSDTNCPSADAISLRLMGLLPAGGPERASARVGSDGTTMHVELSTSGESIQRRSVPAGTDCDSRAETAALIIAAWLDALPVGNISAPGIPPRAMPAREQADTGGSDDADETPLKLGRRTLLGIGLVGTVDRDGQSGSAVIEAAMPRLLDEFGMAIRASGGLPRELAVGAGTARYLRPTFVLAVTAGAQGRRFGFRVQLGPALGALFVWGKGYDDNKSDQTVMWGVDVGLLGTARIGNSEAWVRLGVIDWPQGRSIRSQSSATGAEDAVQMPSAEASLSLGYSWALR